MAHFDPVHIFDAVKTVRLSSANGKIVCQDQFSRGTAKVRFCSGKSTKFFRRHSFVNSRPIFTRSIILNAGRHAHKTDTSGRLRRGTPKGSFLRGEIYHKTWRPTTPQVSGPGQPNSQERWRLARRIFLRNFMRLAQTADFWRFFKVSRIPDHMWA